MKQQPSNQRETGAAPSRPVLSLSAKEGTYEGDRIEVAVVVAGQRFAFMLKAPDLQGNIMASDKNDRWIRQNIADLLKLRFGKML